MIEILKKQWFVVLVAVMFIGFAIYCVYDTNKGKLPGKKVDGKEVVATMKDYTLTADDLYTSLYKENNGAQTLYIRFQNLVIDESVKTDDALKTRADEIAKTLQSQAESMASYYSTTAETLIASQLKSYGFEEDDLDGYALMAAKNEKLRDAYIDAHKDELLTPFYKDKKPRVVSHILIKVADVNNPTKEEQKKIDEVEKALKDGTDFAEVAKKYSDDTGSKDNGGYIGYVDSTNPSKLVQSFVDASLKLTKDGEVSGWVKESNDSYSGWHMIKADKAQLDTLLKDKDVKNQIYSSIASSSNDMSFKYIWEAAKKLDIKYANDDVKKDIMNYMGVEE